MIPKLESTYEKNLFKGSAGRRFHKEIAGYENETELLHTKWYDSIPFAEYLEKRHLQSDAKAKNASARYLSELDFPALEGNHIVFLHQHAVRIAQRTHSHSVGRTPEERYAKTILEKIFILSNRRNLISLLYKKEPIGVFMPDFFLPGIRPSFGTRFLTYEGTKKKTKWTGLVMEIDGKVHEFKTKKDNLHDQLLAKLGIFVHRVSNDELHSSHGKKTLKNYIRSLLLQRRPQKKVLQKLQARIAILNIATYLKPMTIDVLLKEEFGIAFKSAEGLNLLRKWKNCPRIIKYGVPITTQRRIHSEK